MNATATEQPRTITMTATYSPEDNKLRLYASARLDKETYDRVKAAGFKWAPKQDLFVAPMWTPERAALLVELCGEIGDEDTSLVERAEERAERFEEYSDKREADAHSAREAVQQISQRFEFGQPILVGHHSEKRARKDAERIESGMRKAVQMWGTSKYWTDRAKGAIKHAKYKELPGVRHRRIKGLEADKRKQERAIEHAEKFCKLWNTDGLTLEQAARIANYDRVYIHDPARPYGTSLWDALDKKTITAEDAARLAIEHHDAAIERAREWVAHLDNRLAYERAMLGESGGIAADRFAIEVGGRVLCSGWRARKGWLVVLRVTRKGGAISSVRTSEGLVSVEEVADYRAPAGDDAAKVKAATRLPPLVNFPGAGDVHMTKAQWDKTYRDYKGSKVVEANAEHGAYRYRSIVHGGALKGVYITDAKRVDPPAPAAAPEPPAELPVPLPPPISTTAPRPVAPRVRTAFDDMKDSLRAGVVAVSAPQLFPTPPDLAARMVREANIHPHHRILEPSAGTGAILRELTKIGTQPGPVAIEINEALVRQLKAQYPLPLAPSAPKILHHDFLARGVDSLGYFDRIVMNPPFADGQDVDHVTHAWALLRPNGRLVAIMSAAVEFRQDRRYAAFRALVEEHGGTIEKLPPGTFKESGTGVNTVLVVLDK